MQERPRGLSQEGLGRLAEQTRGRSYLLAGKALSGAKTSSPDALVASFLRFIAVGIASLVVDVAAFAVFLGVGLPYPIAVTLGFLLSWAFNFTAHKLFTFRQRGWAVGEVGRYLIAAGTNYLLTMAWVAASVELVGLTPFLGKLTSLPMVTMVSFLLARLWVFRPRSGGN